MGLSPMVLEGNSGISVHYALVNDDGEEEPRYGLADEAGKININKATF